jgi:tRNA(Ile2) C34 agmatinyltransferase TiaS
MKKREFKMITVSGVMVPNQRICPTCGAVAHLTGVDSFYFIFTCEKCGKQPLAQKDEIRECPGVITA